MNRFRVSVTENFGNHNDEAGEESMWGPYVTWVELEDKTIETASPVDFVADANANIENVLLEETYISFDVYDDISEHHEPGAYCRYNFYVTEDLRY